MHIPDAWRHAAPVLAVGVLLLAVSCFGVIRSRRFLAGAERATGRIVAVETSRQGAPGSTVKYRVCRPVVVFTTIEGVTVRATAVTGSTIRPVTGTAVDVLYDPSHPNQGARIDTTRGRGTAALGLLGVAGAVLILVGLRLALLR
ncbi:hypothetical protein GCM10022220_23460 [Actinocatenispora rupis]|uniref:DUF3592 domain-containing protein n=2 Tax=Actinocatenispora rupis TaxID=519421 RepID=A0A8J3J5B3_9ACTN|nr:hypothetical protein Aru02nite_27700 [Actinocatenispora rupis]